MSDWNRTEDAYTRALRDLGGDPMYRYEHPLYGARYGDIDWIPDEGPGIDRGYRSPVGAVSEFNRTREQLDNTVKELEGTVGGGGGEGSAAGEGGNADGNVGAGETSASVGDMASGFASGMATGMAVAGPVGGMIGGVIGMANTASEANEADQFSEAANADLAADAAIDPNPGEAYSGVDTSVDTGNSPGADGQGVGVGPGVGTGSAGTGTGAGSVGDEGDDGPGVGIAEGGIVPGQPTPENVRQDSVKANLSPGEMVVEKPRDKPEGFSEEDLNLVRAFMQIKDDLGMQYVMSMLNKAGKDKQKMVEAQQKLTPQKEQPKPEGAPPQAPQQPAQAPVAQPQPALPGAGPVPQQAQLPGVSGPRGPLGGLPSFGA